MLPQIRSLFLEGTWLGNVGSCSLATFFLRRLDICEAGEHLPPPIQLLSTFLSPQIRWAETFLRGRSHLSRWEALRRTGEAQSPDNQPPSCSTSRNLQGGGLPGPVSEPQPEGPGSPLATEGFRALVIPFPEIWSSGHSSHPPSSF